MTDRWKVTVDRQVCVRTGLCAATAPAEFELDDSGQGRAAADPLAASAAVRDVAESCPVEAITITDAATGEPVFPPQSVTPQR
jgi:ferredoxin